MPFPRPRLPVSGLVSGQIDYALDRFLECYGRDPRWRDDLVKYAEGGRGRRIVLDRKRE